MNNAIIILNYNNSKETINAIQNITEIESIQLIVAVDNGSSKENYELLRNFISKQVTDKQITLLENENNLGYAKGNNVGFQWLSEKKFNGNVAVMNPDVRISKADFNIMMQTLENIGSDSFIAPTTMDNISHWDFSRPEEDLKYRFGNIPRLYQHDSEIKGESPTEYRKVEVLSGAFLLANMKVWSKIGFFDPNTFLYFEEDILQYKASKMGISSYLAVNSIMTHSGQSSTDVGESNVQKVYNYIRRLNTSRFYFYNAYLNTPKSIINKLKIYRSIYLVGKTIKTLFGK